MRILKSLCLGSAAGLVAVAGANAADLPVKAKPVEYVKVCSLYGAGFYYIPGTDTCIKVGGYVRFEAYHNSIGSHAPFLFNNSQAAFTRVTDTFAMRARGMLTADARSQTEYGTLRGDVRFGIQTTTAPSQAAGAPAIPAPAVAAERATSSSSRASRLVSPTRSSTSTTARLTASRRNSPTPRSDRPASSPPPTPRNSATACRPRSRWKTGARARRRCSIRTSSRL